MTKAAPGINLNKKRRKPGCLLTLFLGLFSCVLILLIANYLAGIHGGDTAWHNYTRPSPKPYDEAIPGKEVTNPLLGDYSAGEPYLGKGVTFHIKINNLGFRGPDTTQAPPSNTHRVICLGDSNTFGYGVDDSQCFVRRLENILNETHPAGRFEAVNLGNSGASSYCGRLLLRDRGLALKPEIIIIAYGINDRWSVDTRANPMLRKPDKDIWPIDRKATIKEVLFDHPASRIIGEIRGSNLAKLIKKKTPASARAGLYPKSIRPIPRVSLEDYGDNLKAMVAMASAAGARVLFLGFNMDKNYAARMKEIAAELQVPCLFEENIYKSHWDEAMTSGRYESNRQWSERYLGKEFLSQSPMFYLHLDAFHPTALGHDLIARDLSDEILKMMKK